MSEALTGVPSERLLASVRDLVRRGNEAEAELVAHLGEVDARRLYLEQGCSSMFVWCVRELHFAESVAYKRIQAVRAARAHPEILNVLRSGDLHLTAVSLLAPKLTKENCAELISAARHRSADLIRQMLADREPRPSAPTLVHRIPLGGERYRVQFTADSETHIRLQELRASMRHQIPDGDVGKILARAVEVLLGQVRKQKYAETARPRPASRASEQPSRQIPAAIRRAVWVRDGGRCTYMSPEERRCNSRDFIEFDHAAALGVHERPRRRRDHPSLPSAQSAARSTRFWRAAHGPIRTSNWIWIQLSRPHEVRAENSFSTCRRVSSSDPLLSIT